MVVHAVGARPNFVKMAPVVGALGAGSRVRQIVVHTEQHYDRHLADDVLADLDFREPDFVLGVGSGSHAEQTGRALVAFERVLLEVEPDLVVVAGDVNSTLACALAAVKVGVGVAHVESGLRSRDWTMPEEINRVLTDRLSDLLFTHSPEAGENLVAEGIEPDRIHYVGNTMIDSLRRLEPRARAARGWERFDVREGDYVLVTLHRPSNVDRPDRLAAVTRALTGLASRHPVLFPVHPRTRARLEAAGIEESLSAGSVACIEPLGYLDFLSLETAAGAIVTDSGGIQEEASALGVPCYTLRPNTERPITLTHGTNVLLGDDPAALDRVRVAAVRAPSAIPLWDGHAGERIARTIEAYLDVSPPAVAAGS